MTLCPAWPCDRPTCHVATGVSASAAPRAAAHAPATYCAFWADSLRATRVRDSAFCDRSLQQPEDPACSLRFPASLQGVAVVLTNHGLAWGELSVYTGLPTWPELGLDSAAIVFSCSAAPSTVLIFAVSALSRFPSLASRQNACRGWSALARGCPGLFRFSARRSTSSETRSCVGCELDPRGRESASASPVPPSRFCSVVPMPGRRRGLSPRTHHRLVPRCQAGRGLLRWR